MIWLLKQNNGSKITDDSKDFAKMTEECEGHKKQLEELKKKLAEVSIRFRNYNHVHYFLISFMPKEVRQRHLIKIKIDEPGLVVVLAQSPHAERMKRLFPATFIKSIMVFSLCISQPLYNSLY